MYIPKSTPIPMATSNNKSYNDFGSQDNKSLHKIPGINPPIAMRININKRSKNNQSRLKSFGKMFTKIPPYVFSVNGKGA